MPPIVDKAPVEPPPLKALLTSLSIPPETSVPPVVAPPVSGPPIAYRTSSRSSLVIVSVGSLSGKNPEFGYIALNSSTVLGNPGKLTSSVLFPSSSTKSAIVGGRRSSGSNSSDPPLVILYIGTSPTPLTPNIFAP